MLEGLDRVPWGELEHAYGTAEDVPDLLRSLLDSDPAVRKKTLHELYGNVFHQGTRYPATPYVVPFLIELCASPEVPGRAELLEYWGDLIVGYFNVQERPLWGDGERVYWGGEVAEVEEDDPYTVALHEIYRESLHGYDLLRELLADDDPGIRAGAAWVLACLPTRKTESIPRLEAQLWEDPEELVRAASAFALGELGATAPLRSLLERDPSPAVRCMAVCELARVAPSAELLDVLLPFLKAPLEGYEQVRGAGGASTGDAAHAIALLPAEVRPQAIPALFRLLGKAKVVETMPIVLALLAAAFTPRQEPVTELTEDQRVVLERMIQTKAVWKFGNLMDIFAAYGLPFDRTACQQLVESSSGTTAG